MYFLFSNQNMADAFLDGAAPLDTFIDEYQSKRKLAHLRRVKIEKLQEMVLKGARMPAAALQPSRSLDLPSTPAALQREVNGSPMPMPRRAPPLPPSKVPQSPTIQQPAAVSYHPVSPFLPTSPYPPIPPRVGNPPSGLNQGYPSIYMQQYPPPLPQRTPQRMAHQPGFIMQWGEGLQSVEKNNIYTGHSFRPFVGPSSCMLYSAPGCRDGVLSYVIN